jgi:alanyl aminopeptidase
MKTYLLAALAALCAILPAAAQQPPTFRLGDAATPHAYELALAIDPRQERFSGTVRITLRVNHAADALWLNAEDLDIDEAVFENGGRRVTARMLPAPHDFAGFAIEGGFQPGDYVAEIRFRAPLEPLDTRGLFRQREGGEWYAITQFEAISARRAFPCFDEPQWKTPWRVTIDAPAADRVVWNTPEERAVDAPGKAGWKRHVFAESKPLTTYLVAFAVGPFDIVAGAPGGAQATPLRYLAPRGRGADARYAKAVTPQLLGELEKYFGIPYPF